MTIDFENFEKLKEQAMSKHKYFRDSRRSIPIDRRPHLLTDASQMSATPKHGRILLADGSGTSITPLNLTGLLKTRTGRPPSYKQFLLPELQTQRLGDR